MERWRKALGGRTITLINAMERNTMGYKYTNTQRYKYTNTAAPMHIVEIIKRIETWLFSFLKQM